MLAPIGAVGCGEIDSIGDGGGGEASEVVTLKFEQQGTLELRPREKSTLLLDASPGTTVTLLLLGDALDASLGEATAQADANGLASVQLVAPSQPTTFVVRAQVGDLASAELHVAVSEQGFATVDIIPSYTGKRDLSGWSADILVGGSCEDILAGYPQNPVGALHVESSTLSGLSIESVPVGPELAVAVRSGSLAAGCANFSAKHPEGVDEITITVLDRQVDLSGAELDVSLVYSPSAPSDFGAIVRDGALEVADVAFPTTTPLSTLLLDEMGLLIPEDSSSSFAALREQSALDDVVASDLEGVDPHAFCASLAEAGAALAVARTTGADLATIDGRVSGQTDQPGKASFALASFLGFDASELSTPPGASFSWSASVDDLLVITGVLPVAAARVGAAFMKDAYADQGGTTSIPDAITEAIDCAQIAQTITYNGAVEGCDQACLEDACATAAASRWELGVSADDEANLGNLQIGVSGTMSVSGDLVPLELQGTWLGTLSSPLAQTQISGDASGHAPPPR